MPEILTPGRFEKIGWSRGHRDANGDVISIPGVTQITVRNQNSILDSEHRLTVETLPSPIIHSRIRFGHPGYVNFTFRSKERNPFDLEDHERINQATSAVSEMIATLHQMETAVKVEESGETLLRALKMSIGFVSEQRLADIGVISGVLARYKRSSSIEHLLEKARMARALDISIFYEGKATSLPGIQWNVDSLIYSFETGDFTKPQEIAKYTV